MKVATGAISTMAAQKSPAVISLRPDASEEELLPEHTTQFTLSSRPTENDQTNVAKYKAKCRILQGEESVQQLVSWYRQVNKVLHGLNVINNYAEAVPIVETMLSGTPLTLFKDMLVTCMEERMQERIDALNDDDADARNAEEVAIQGRGANHPDNQQYGHVDKAIRHMLTELFPRRALARVKRFLRRECRKPIDMPVRKYYQRILRINVEVVPNLPPFEPTQNLQQDEITDIILFGTPRSWQREMDRQGFDPLDSTLGETIEFMERLEANEEFNQTSKTVSNKSSKTTKKKSPNGSSNGNGNGNSSGGGRYNCSHHGPNNTHNSDKCFVLHPELKKSSGKNKTWSRKAHDSKKEQNEIMAMVKKQVAETLKTSVKSELAAFAKKVNKRKVVENDSSDEDLCAFDYTQFEDLVIDDKLLKETDEVSI